MMSPTTVVPCRLPDTIEDAPTATLRSGVRRLLAQTVEAFLASLAGVPLPYGHERVVRPGYGTERHVHTGIGLVAIRRMKPRDRGTGEAAERIPFTPSCLPSWARRTPILDARLPEFYLCGISTSVPGGAWGAVG